MMVRNKTPFFRTIIFGWVLLCRVDKLPGCSVECCYLKGTAPQCLGNDHRTLEKQNPIEMASWVGKWTAFCNCLVVSNIELEDSFKYFWETFMYGPLVVATDWLLRNNPESLHWERSDLRPGLCKPEILLKFIFSQAPELQAMAEFSLSLSLRASQQILGAKMYGQNLRNRICTFVEVASALVMVQLGLMTETYYCLFPFLFLLFVGFCHASMLEAQDLTQSFSVSRMAVHVQHIFLCIFSSEVSLLEAMPSGVARFLSLLARVACSLICFQSVSFGACPSMNADYSCFRSALAPVAASNTTRSTTTLTTKAVLGEPMSQVIGAAIQGQTASLPKFSEQQKNQPTALSEDSDSKTWVGWSYFLEERNSDLQSRKRPDDVSWYEETRGWSQLRENKSQEIYNQMCESGKKDKKADKDKNADEADEFQLEIDGVSVLVYEAPLSRAKLCSKELMPAMFQPSCEVAEADSVQYQRCVQTNAEGACNAAFMLCTTIKGSEGSLEAPRFLLIFYIYLPHIAVCLLAVLFCCTGAFLHLASGLKESIILGCLTSGLLLWVGVIWLRHALWLCINLMGHLLLDFRIPFELVLCGRDCERLQKGSRRRWKSLYSKWPKLINQQSAEIERVGKRNAETAKLAKLERTGERFKQEMQKEIQMKTKELLTQLDTGTLCSPFWGRKNLQLKLLLFCFDILLDIWCCLQFFLTENYGFGACQCGIMILSGCVQLFIARDHSVWQEWKKSWEFGLPTNTLFTLLVAEKAFEAPLSLCLQYLSAFHLTANLRAFVSLEISMVISLVGIGEGIYTSRLLAECTGRNVVSLLPKLPPHPELPRLLTEVPSASSVEVPPPGMSPTPKVNQGALPPPPGMSPTPKVNQGALPPPPGMSPTPKVNQGALPPPPGMSPTPKVNQGALPPPPGMSPTPKVNQGALPPPPGMSPTPKVNQGASPPPPGMSPTPKVNEGALPPPPGMSPTPKVNEGALPPPPGMSPTLKVNQGALPPPPGMSPTPKMNEGALPPPPGMSPTPKVNEGALPPPPGVSPTPKVNEGALPPPPGMSPTPKVNEGALPPPPGRSPMPALPTQRSLGQSVPRPVLSMGQQHADGRGQEAFKFAPIQLEGQRARDTEWCISNYTDGWWGQNDGGSLTPLTENKMFAFKTHDDQQSVWWSCCWLFLSWCCRRIGVESSFFCAIIALSLPQAAWWWGVFPSVSFVTWEMARSQSCPLRMWCRNFLVGWREPRRWRHQKLHNKGPGLELSKGFARGLQPNDVETYYPQQWRKVAKDSEEVSMDI